MNYDEMTIDQLSALLEDCDQERLALRERARRIREARDRAIRNDHLDHWGLTQAQYDEAKQQAASLGVSPHVCLNEARVAAHRAARKAQTAQPLPATMSVRAK